MALTVDCNNPPNIQDNVWYSHTVTVTGGTPPYRYEITSGTLPTGLTLDPWTGVISGTPDLTGASFARLDATVHNDQGAPMDCYWESGLVRDGEQNSSMVRFGNADVWIRGEGQVVVSVYGPDKRKLLTMPLRTVNGQPMVALDPTPGIMYALKFDLHQVENCTFRFETTTKDAWFEMSGFRAYFRPDLYNR
jgi:hypothetical protein